MRSGRCVAALVLPFALLAACGEDGGEPADTAGDSASQESTEPSDDASTTDLEECATVWQDGASLPRDYRGCAEEGSAVEPEQRECSFGKPLVTYDDQFYAVRGGTIHRTASSLDEDRGYRSAMKSCMA